MGVLHHAALGDSHTNSYSLLLLYNRVLSRFQNLVGGGGEAIGDNAAVGGG